MEEPGDLSWKALAEGAVVVVRPWRAWEEVEEAAGLNLRVEEEEEARHLMVMVAEVEERGC